MVEKTISKNASQAAADIGICSSQATFVQLDFSSDANRNTSSLSLFLLLNQRPGTYILSFTFLSPLGRKH